MTSTPFHDLDDFLRLPRVAGLAVSPDGERVVTTIAELNDAATEFITAVWELDPNGVEPARRITHGGTGESAPVFTHDGDLLFLARRPGPDEEKPPSTLWRLPAAGGEAHVELALPGGVDAALPARGADVVLVGAALLPSAGDVEEDGRLRALRKDGKVSAVLHSGYPVRFWDHDIGPAQPHLLVLDGLRDLTPNPGPALREADVDVSRDGHFAIATWRVPAPGASSRVILVRWNTDNGAKTTVVDDPDADLSHPAVSPDGSRVAYLRESFSTPEQAPRITLWYSVFGEDPIQLASGWDRWPTSVAWAHDGSVLLVTADENGRGPVFAVDPTDSTVTRLTDDDFTYTNVTPAPGGGFYALRSSYAFPPHPVRVAADGTATSLPCVDVPALPGDLVETTAVTADGATVRSWLVLPDGSDPAPLALWIHGGPLNSWNAWHWRWCPWLLAARGYAVLLPDPALSTGYGQEFVQRGWGAWGEAPYADLMTAVDAAQDHPRVDGTRTAAMGGSFGGYMANWIAGHTDRFRAIVTHASLWALDQFAHTTDGADWWAREMTGEMTDRNSPHRSVGDIRTPMLVVHGDKDYRVPVGEALRLWYELLSCSGLPAAADGTSPHRFLYYPDEGHWIASPQHAKIWYQVVASFLGVHVLGLDEDLPEALG
ncbi:S9 family peptidase [Mycolicibacterium sediminis]|uniref:S9 family peptidase n=1 Tax=Mycolicibacterium sediminis TaxID=1286180 RepID=UPI0013D19FAA|nr:prolyl oligopeptidase family serine peptidase [Mycolicibacterium sediminis]